MNKSEHSFYREAKKSFLSQDEFSWKKFFKKFSKYLKIFIYLFLVTITLWGCVNQFRHSTSGSVSQGLEFYSDYDSVLPNLYEGVPTSQTYQIVETTEGEEGDEESLIPFDFYTINPNYGITSENESVNTDDLFVKAGDVTDSSGNPQPYYLGYSVNYTEANLILFRYDWSNYINVNPDENYLWVLPWITLPDSLKEEVGDWNDDGETTFYDFYTYLGFDPANEDESILFETDSDENYIAAPIYQAYLAPTQDMYNSGSWDWTDKNNWQIIEGINFQNPTESEWGELETSEQEQIINEQIIYFTNAASYITHQKVSSNEAILPDDDRSIEEIVIENFGKDPTTWNRATYTADFWPLYDLSLYQDDLDNRNDELAIYSGVAYSVIRQEKESPLYPSEDAINTFQNERSDDWYIDSVTGEPTQAGTQSRTDNAGWVLLDDNGDLLSLQNENSSNDDEYLYGDNPEEFRDRILEDRTSIDGTEQSSNSYSLESQLQLSPGLEGNDMSISYNPDFIGMMSINEAQGFSVSKGVTATPQDSISASGQSPINEGHDIFVGSLNDWGDSWNPEYGPMYGIFVYPLSQLSLIVNSWFPYATFGVWGVLLGIFLITFMLRGLGILMSIGSSKNQYKMQEIQPMIAEINAKYAMYDKSNKQMKQKKQMEIMALYKKHEVNPFATIGTIFVTLPIFLSLFTIISAIPIYKTATLGVFSFSVSAFYGMFNISSMFIAYMLVGVCVGFSQGVSSKMPGWLSNKRRGIKQVDDATKQAMKKQKRTQNILIGVFVFIGLTVSVLLAIYWIFSALFTISNELVRHAFKQHKAKKAKSKST